MKNSKRQFSRSSVMYIIFGIALIGIMTLLGASAFLGVNYFVITGAKIYTTEQVIEASGVSRGNNLLYLNTNSVAQNIRRELPYIDTVVISREFPDTLAITVTESVAVAYLIFEGDTVIIDSSGRVLERFQHAPGAGAASSISELIEIRGVIVSEASVGIALKSELGVEQFLSTMQNVLKSMEREGIIDNVNYLDVSNINNIHFGYQGIYRIIVGGIGDIRLKLSKLPSHILEIQRKNPNTRGVYNMTGDSERYSFTPE